MGAEGIGVVGHSLPLHALDSRFRGNDRRVCCCHCEERSDEAISGWDDAAGQTLGLPRLLLARLREWLAMTRRRIWGMKGVEKRRASRQLVMVNSMSGTEWRSAHGYCRGTAHRHEAGHLYPM
jgi:hypothetical protein